MKQKILYKNPINCCNVTRGNRENSKINAETINYERFVRGLRYMHLSYAKQFNGNIT